MRKWATESLPSPNLHSKLRQKMTKLNTAEADTFHWMTIGAEPHERSKHSRTAASHLLQHLHALKVSRQPQSQGAKQPLVGDDIASEPPIQS
jgi:hypothetical protein